MKILERAKKNRILKLELKICGRVEREESIQYHIKWIFIEDEVIVVHGDKKN